LRFSPLTILSHTSAQTLFRENEINTHTKSTDGGTAPMTLWGTPHSLYTGKVRSYLIKKGLPYREQFPHHPRFNRALLPAVRLFVVPVLELAAGEFHQDSCAIIELLEARFPQQSMLPEHPVQRVVARLLDAFGSEGMLPAAMHYRWSYRAEQEDFLRAEFGRVVHCGSDRPERLAAGKQLMDYFSGWLPALGVGPESIPAIEAAHTDLLDALDVHFLHHPYLLGGRPCVADFGFMAPLFAHLGRDPVPLALMQRRAPNVYRWIERMQRAQIEDGEFPEHRADWLPGGAVPATLDAVLGLLFADWGPQLLADAALVNNWMAQHASLPEGALVSADGQRSVHPTLGAVSYAWRGVTANRASAPHGLWHFGLAAAEARALHGAHREQFDALVRRLGGEQTMGIQLVRPLRRHDHVLVLG
jgi:glutathione S-transferase